MTASTCRKMRQDATSLRTPGDSKHCQQQQNHWLVVSYVAFPKSLENKL